MNRGDRRFLERLKRQSRHVDLSAAIDRVYLRDVVWKAAQVRAILAELGIDPDRVPALIRAEGAAAKLAAIPDTPELRRADRELLAADERANPVEGEHPWESVVRKIKKGVRYWAETGRTPDFGEASFPTIFEWCLAQDQACIDWANGLDIDTSEDAEAEDAEQEDVNEEDIAAVAEA